MNHSNEYEILDKSFLGNILKLSNKNNLKTYLELISKCKSENDLLDIEFETKEYEYRSERQIIMPLIK